MELTEVDDDGKKQLLSNTNARSDGPSQHAFTSHDPEHAGGHDAHASPYKSKRALDAEIMSMALPMLAALAADPVASLVDSAYLGHAGSVQLAAVGVALSVFNTATRLLNTPLLYVTTSAVAKATGSGRAADAAGGRDGGGGVDAASAEADGGSGAVTVKEAAEGRARSRSCAEACGSEGPGCCSGGAVGTRGGDSGEGRHAGSIASTRGGDGSTANTRHSLAAAAASAIAASQPSQAEAALSLLTEQPRAEADGSKAGGSSCAGDWSGARSLEAVASGAVATAATAARAAADVTSAPEASADGAGTRDPGPLQGADRPHSAAATTTSAAPTLASAAESAAASSCLLLALLLGLLQTGGLLGAGPALLSWWGVPPASPVRRGAVGFLAVRAGGAPLTILMIVMQGVFRGLQDTRTPLHATLLANAVNLVLAPALIFGARLGAVGAALGAVSGQAAAVAFLVRRLRRRMPGWSLVAANGDSGGGAGRCDSGDGGGDGGVGGEGEGMPLLPVPLWRKGSQDQDDGGSESADAELAGGGPGRQLGRQAWRLRAREAACRLWGALREVLPLFRPTGFLVLRNASALGTYAVATSMVAHGGPALTAAHQIAFQLWLAASLLADALAVAAQSLMARDLGAGSPGGAAAVAGRVAGWAAWLGLGIAGALAAGWRLLPRAFSSDAEVLGLVTHLFPLIFATQPITVSAMAWDGILFGSGGFRFAAISMAAAAAPAILTMQLGSRMFAKDSLAGVPPPPLASFAPSGVALAPPGLLLSAPPPSGVGASPAAAAAVSQAAAASPPRLYGFPLLVVVWVGLVVLMLLRWAAIAVPYVLRLGPFRQLRRPRP